MQFANASSSEPAGESGSSRNPAGGQRFSLQSRAAASSFPPGDRQSVAILLIEDNPADATLVRRALEEHGVTGEITVFADGENAIRFIRALDTDPSDRPDLIIIDLNLPRRPGRDVLESIRQSEQCSGIPAVILSSSDAQEDRADAARLGASDYIQKPSRLEEFLRLGAVFKQMIARARD